MEVEKKVHEKFLNLGKKIAFAESCTGGLLMSSLTKFPGASSYMLGGIVCYSNELKENLLNIESSLLKEFGAVSKECALAMSENLEKLLNSDIAIAVTGILGPSGFTADKPVGTVWLAIKLKNQETFSEKIPLPKDLSRARYLQIVKDYIMEALWKL
jgi:PncC family amidohydrolase